MDIPIDHLKMNVKHNLSELHKGLEGVMAAKAQAPAGSTTAIVKMAKIQKVPAVLLERKDRAYFEPRWISFGPIHYGNSKFKVAEKYKLELVAKFIRDGGYSSANELYNKIESDMTGVKGCFDEEVIQHFDDEDLKRILFFDGCVILQFINSCFKRDHLKELKIKNDQVAFIQHDLFLLENQIPYQVLQVLLNHSTKETKDQLQKSLNDFIEAMNVMAPENNNHRSFNIAEIETNSEPTHLLDLLRLALLHPPAVAIKRTIREHLALLLPITNKKTDQEEYFRVRTIRDLKAAGIKLRPSKTCSLRDVSFSSMCFPGELELPPLIVDESMAPKLMNLVALEMCPDNTRTEGEVTSFICFLSSLIGSSGDVKELTNAEILHNFLSSDEELVQLFKMIATELVPNPKTYGKVIGRIQRYFKENKMATWIAKNVNPLLNYYFSTPWSGMTFISVVAALFLAATQTWFTVYPSPGPCDNFCRNLKKS